jgi:mannose-6-phosphate isomerase class I
MLNSVHLNPGDAIYLGAGEPHAYISGGQYYSFSLNSPPVLPSYHLKGRPFPYV